MKRYRCSRCGSHVNATVFGRSQYELCRIQVRAQEQAPIDELLRRGGSAARSTVAEDRRKRQGTAAALPQGTRVVKGHLYAPVGLEGNRVQCLNCVSKKAVEGLPTVKDCDFQPVHTELGTQYIAEWKGHSLKQVGTLEEPCISCSRCGRQWRSKPKGFCA